MGEVVVKLCNVLAYGSKLPDLEDQKYNIKLRGRASNNLLWRWLNNYAKIIDGALSEIQWNEAYPNITLLNSSVQQVYDEVLSYISKLQHQETWPFKMAADTERTPKDTIYLLDFQPITERLAEIKELLTIQKQFTCSQGRDAIKILLKEIFRDTLSNLNGIYSKDFRPGRYEWKTAIAELEWDIYTVKYRAFFKYLVSPEYNYQADYFHLFGHLFPMIRHWGAPILFLLEAIEAKHLEQNATEAKLTNHNIRPKNETEKFTKEQDSKEQTMIAENSKIVLGTRFLAECGIKSITTGFNHYRFVGARAMDLTVATPVDLQRLQTIVRVLTTITGSSNLLVTYQPNRTGRGKKVVMEDDESTYTFAELQPQKLDDVSCNLCHRGVGLGQREPGIFFQCAIHPREFYCSDCSYDSEGYHFWGRWSLQRVSHNQNATLQVS